MMTVNGTLIWSGDHTNFDGIGITRPSGTADVNGWGCPGFVRPYYPGLFEPVPVPAPEPVTTGWKCPGCGRCYAPGILMCLACEPTQEETVPPSDPAPEEIHEHDGVLNRRIKA